MSNEPQFPYEPQYPPRSAAASRTSAPGVLLVVVGVINILWAFYLIGEGAFNAAFPEDAVRRGKESIKQLEETFPGFKDAKQAPTTPEQARMTALGEMAFGLLCLVASIVTILGGIRMRSLRSYGLAMTGSIAAAIPCISCMGCCGVGEIVGLWAIIVLMNPDVKGAFQSAAATGSEDYPPPL